MSQVVWYDLDWMGVLSAGLVVFALGCQASVGLWARVSADRKKRASVGGGIHECKIDYGPGYRVYFGMDGKELVILVGGGTKKRQSSDINDAASHWADYKKRKKNTDKGG